MDNSLILAFQFCVEVHERHGLYITSSFGFSGRVEVFSDFPLPALLDRLTHHCHVLLFQGKSCCFQESRERLMRAAASVATTPRSAYRSTFGCQTHGEPAPLLPVAGAG